MKIRNIFAAICCTALLSSCAVTLPYAVTNNNVGNKTGTSSTISIGSGSVAHLWVPTGSKQINHGLIFNQKFGIVEAAREGGIQRIGSVDFKITSYIFFSKLEWVVTGD